MTEDQQITSTEMEEESFSLWGQFKQLWHWVLYALQHWKLLLLAALIGGSAGLSYTWWKPVSYRASITFVVEESKVGGGGSLMSALAGQFGVDISNLSGGNGVLSGDNVLQLLKSPSLIRKTLLLPIDSTGKKSLADEYVAVYGLNKKWEKNSKIGKPIFFVPNSLTRSRVEDSLLQQVVIKNILEKELVIAKPDKKLGFFELAVSTRSEMLSVIFCEQLLKVATDFYIDTKTKRLSTNVKRLQDKADSLLYALNRKTYSAADANRQLLDVNPVYAVPEVSAEISSRDKVIQGTIYAEIVKNLEISKTSLIQETPTVQIVDAPVLPLKDNKTDWWKGVLAGAALLVFVSGVLVVALKSGVRG